MKISPLVPLKKIQKFNGTPIQEKCVKRFLVSSIILKEKDLEVYFIWLSYLV